MTKAEKEKQKLKKLKEEKKEKQKEKQKKMRAFKKFLGVKFQDQLPQGILFKFGVETKSVEEAIKFLEGLNLPLLEALQRTPTQKEPLTD